MLFIYSESTDPFYNLAAEEFLVRELSDEIFMLWRNDNTIVVGRNQNTLSEINYDYVKEHGVRVVRRMSGGGAVYHDMGNVNFTFVLNSGDDFSNYEKFTAPVIAFLKTLGADAELKGRNDLVIDGKKISGNAQYMYKNRIMHHGTLLYSAQQKNIGEALRVSPDKIRSKGIQSVRSRVTNISSYLENPPTPEVFIQKFADYVVKNTAHCQNYDLSRHDAAIRKLRDEKYATWEWNFGYSPKYDFSRRLRFPYGGVEVHMNIGDGSVIQNVKFYGDFFSRLPVTEFEQLLSGTRHEAEAICTVLKGHEVGAYIQGMTIEDLLKLLF